ncbi:MAG: hypothetical protein LBV68_08790 [Spirochaetaceae bacterium]|jgi:hypothetical protein|nr:hypothetical protein [Spirochaetaceae bacterium]
MDLVHNGRLKIAALLIHNAFVFFLLAAVLAFFFYLAGTAQDFAESTQLFLLKIVWTASLFLFLFAIFSIICDLGASVLNKGAARFKMIVIYAFCGFMALTFVFLSGALIIFAKGNML